MQAGDLERNVALERAVGASSEPDVCHAAGPQQPQQFVGAEPLARVPSGRFFLVVFVNVDARRTVQDPDCSHVLGEQRVAQRQHKRLIRG